MTELIKISTLVLFVVFLLSAMVLRSIMVWRRTGINPLIFNPASDSAHDYVGRWFALVLVGYLSLVVGFAFVDGWAQLLGLLAFLDDSIVKVVGLFVVVAALVVVWVAQHQMGAAWRIGIDQNNETELVQRGLFKHFRNPIFGGMLLALIGLTLIIPTLVSVGLLTLSYLLLQIQVRLEEEHLLKLHGERYDRYRRQARRWLFRWT